MSPPLFRPEAVEHAARRLEGEIVLATPIPLRVFAYSAATIVVLGLIFAASTQYSRKESVVGRLTPEGGLIRVVAREAGVVERLAVVEGQIVEPSAALAQLRLAGELATGDVAVAVDTQIAAENAAADAANAASVRKIQQQRTALEAEAAGLRNQLNEIERRLAIQRERKALSDAAVARAEELSGRGYVTTSSLEARRSAALVAAEDVAASRATAADLRRQISVIDQRQRAVPLEIAAAVATGDQVRASISQRRLRNQASGSIIATAPVAARILALPVDVGQSVEAGRVIALLMPAGSNLVADLYVPSRAAGFIKAGQEVRIRYNAFPYQRFGTAKGVVRSVSQTVLSPKDVAADDLQIDEPVFLVRVARLRQSVPAYGGEIPLQPGMLLGADIVIDRPTLLQWLLDPVYAAGGAS